MALATGACGMMRSGPENDVLATTTTPATPATVEVAHGRELAVPFATSTSPVWREALVFATPAAGAGVGDLRLSWRLDAGSDPAVTTVTIDPDFGGVGLGTTRNDGWRVIPADGPVTLVRGGPSVKVASGVVPAGPFQHVFVAARSATATGTFGDENLIAHVEPIALSGFVPGHGRVDLEIVLIVLRRPSDGVRQIFVKDAFLTDIEIED